MLADVPTTLYSVQLVLEILLVRWYEVKQENCGGKNLSSHLSCLIRDESQQHVYQSRLVFLFPSFRRWQFNRRW